MFSELLVLFVYGQVIRTIRNMGSLSEVCSSPAEHHSAPISATHQHENQHHFGKKGIKERLHLNQIVTIKC